MPFLLFTLCDKHKQVKINSESVLTVNYLSLNDGIINKFNKEQQVEEIAKENM